MNPKKSVRVFALGVGALVLMATGCATKKYVKNSIEPLETRIGNVDQKTSQQIRDLDRKTEAGISDAANKADQANQAAGQAQQAANTADEHAQAARQQADKGLSTANQAQEMVNNIDNYQPGQSAIVLFGLNKSTLTSEDKQHLDELADAVKNLKHYVIEIQGYTDTTGPQQYNLELSQRRAEAVVRYLTSDHDIPLVRIYNMGYGEAAPTADNKTRKGRELNRRVEVKVLVPQMPQAGSAQVSSTALPQ